MLCFHIYIYMYYLIGVPWCVCMIYIYIHYRHIIRIQMSEVFWTGADFFHARALDRGKDEDRIGIWWGYFQMLISNYYYWYPDLYHNYHWDVFYIITIIGMYYHWDISEIFWCQEGTLTFKECSWETLLKWASPGMGGTWYLSHPQPWLKNRAGIPASRPCLGNIIWFELLEQRAKKVCNSTL